MTWEWPCQGCYYLKLREMTKSSLPLTQGKQQDLPWLGPGKWQGFPVVWVQMLAFSYKQNMERLLSLNSSSQITSYSGHLRLLPYRDPFILHDIYNKYPEYLEYCCVCIWVHSPPNHRFQLLCLSFLISHHCQKGFQDPAMQVKIPNSTAYIRVKDILIIVNSSR